jgi:hypothetical protein
LKSRNTSGKTRLILKDCSNKINKRWRHKFQATYGKLLISSEEQHHHRRLVRLHQLVALGRLSALSAVTIHLLLDQRPNHRRIIADIHGLRLYFTLLLFSRNDSPHLLIDVAQKANILGTKPESLYKIGPSAGNIICYWRYYKDQQCSSFHLCKCHYFTSAIWDPR